MVHWDEWFWRELREGGLLHDYLARERAQTERRYRKVAQKLGDFRQNNKSDFRLLAAIPARDYHRWKAEDPHFWDDNSNLKRLRRDNPDARVFV